MHSEDASIFPRVLPKRQSQVSLYRQEALLVRAGYLLLSLGIPIGLRVIDSPQHFGPLTLTPH
jgi:hypothetical protein